jgi:hypothetical protein
MAIQILIPNRITQSRYTKVKGLMETMGPPVISCIEITPGYFFALEGSHRTTAAHELGLVPILNVVDYLEESCPEHIGVFKEVKVREMRGLLLTFDESE